MFIIKNLDLDAIGGEIYDLIEELFPICRSITGNGIRDTLQILSKHIPLKIHEIPSGTKVFDWVIPKEWNIKDAYIKNSKGERVIDFRNSNLHILNYSIPVHKTVSLEELKGHLYTLPENPERYPHIGVQGRSDHQLKVDCRKPALPGHRILPVLVRGSLSSLLYEVPWIFFCH